MAPLSNSDSCCTIMIAICSVVRLRRVRRGRKAQLRSPSIDAANNTDKVYNSNKYLQKCWRFCKSITSAYCTHWCDWYSITNITLNDIVRFINILFFRTQRFFLPVQGYVLHLSVVVRMTSQCQSCFFCVICATWTHHLWISGVGLAA